ncbi:hypothetical protein Tco_0888417, partial [Tanacetum coccineum]
GQDAVQNLGIQIVGNQNGLIVVLEIGNQNANQNWKGNVVATRVKGNGNGNNDNQIRCYNCRGLGQYARNDTEEAGIQLQTGEFDLMDAACDIDEIFYMFTQEEQYTELLEPITEPHSVQQNTSNVIIDEPSVEHNKEIVEQHPATVEETHAYFGSLYNNLVTKVEKVNTVNHKIKEANADLTIELAGYKGQEKCFEFNQEKFYKLESSYKKLVYQEQCLTKKINALHLSSAK